MELLIRLPNCISILPMHVKEKHKIVIIVIIPIQKNQLFLFFFPFILTSVFPKQDSVAYFLCKILFKKIPCLISNYFCQRRILYNKSSKRFWIFQLIFSSSINNIYEPNTILTAICYLNSKYSSTKNCTFHTQFQVCFI